MEAPRSTEASTDAEAHNDNARPALWYADQEEPEVQQLQSRTPPSLESPFDRESPAARVYRPAPYWAQPQTDAEEIVGDEDTGEPTPRPAVPPWIATERRVAEEPEPEYEKTQESPVLVTGTATESKPGPSWLWAAIAGAVLGGLLGVALSAIAFVILNGALDMSRTRAVEELRAQISGLSTELDAIRTDTSGLQGEVSILRGGLDSMADLPGRVEEAESTLSTVTGDVATLQEEDVALRGSLDELDSRTGDLETELETVQGQMRRSMSFFQQLRDLLNDTFGEGP